MMRKDSGSNAVEDDGGDRELGDKGLIAGLRLDNFCEPECARARGRSPGLWSRLRGWRRERGRVRDENIGGPASGVVWRGRRLANGNAWRHRWCRKQGRACERETAGQNGEEPGQGMPWPVPSPA